MFQYIICDPDDHKYEGAFMGLFYTALSRATTLGDHNGIGSAIYFKGGFYKENRFRNIGKMVRSDEDYIPIKKRTNWIAHLQNNTIPITPLTDTMKNTMNWTQQTKFDYNWLYKRIVQYQIAKI